MKKLILFFTGFLFLFLTPKVFAFPKESFITATILVRGEENWQLQDQQPIDFPLYYYRQTGQSGIPTTYMLRFDAINNQQISSRLKDLVATDSAQILGGLLEVTPKLAQAANVEYQNHGSFTSANHLFLSGYERKDRLKIIDTFMDSFFQKFGNYPPVIGVDSLDSFSFNYLVSHYSIISAFIADETFTGSNLRQWGGYLASPYLPSKQNILVPAPSAKDKTNGVIFRWSPTTLNSIFINDSVGKTSLEKFSEMLAVYTDKTLNETTHVNIRLDNNYQLVFNNQKDEIKKIIQSKQYILDLIKILKNNQDKYTLRFISTNQLGELIKARHPETSSAFYYKIDDLYWYQNPFYRFVFRSVNDKAEIVDFKVYNSKFVGNYFDLKNITTIASQEIPSQIDFIKYPQNSIPINFNLKSAKITSEYWDLILTDGEKILKLEPKKITFQKINLPKTKLNQLRIKTNKDQTTWQIKPALPFKELLNIKYFIFGIGLIFLIIFQILKTFTKTSPQTLFFGLSFAFIGLIPVLFSGQIYQFGLGFWGPNGHDAIFHLSLINSFKQSLFNLSHPQIAGLKLQNYHLGVDWLVAFVSRLTGLNQVKLFFVWLPIVFATLIVRQLIKLLTGWKFSSLAIRLSLFFTFLTGSLGFIFTIIKSGNPFAGESLFWMNQSISIFLNLPFALSIVLLLVFLNLYNKKGFSSVEPVRFLSLIFFGGLLAQVKIYAFILLLLSLLIIKELKLFAGIALIGLIILLPTLGFHGSPFIFSPLWFPKSLIAAQDKLNWQKLAQAWQVYEANGTYLKLFLVNLLALGIYIMGNLGIRIIGLLNILKEKSHKKSIILAKSIIFLGLIIPLLFIQANNPWNTIQFSYYSLFFLGIFTAQKLSVKRLSIATWLLVLSIALATTVGTLKDYLTPYSASRISLIELEALETLKNQETGIVISPIFNYQQARPIPEPKSLYAYTSTAYISALSGHPEYLSDLINLSITGFDFKERAKNIQRLFRTGNADWVKNFLFQEKIKYVYQTQLEKLQITPQKACLSPIFLSDEITIYKFACSHNQGTVPQGTVLP